MIEISGEKAPKDWLKFKDTKPYRERIDSAQKSSNEKEALLAMKGSLKNYRLSLQPLNLDTWEDLWVLL